MAIRNDHTEWVISEKRALVYNDWTCPQTVGAETCTQRATRVGLPDAADDDDGRSSIRAGGENENKTRGEVARAVAFAQGLPPDRHGRATGRSHHATVTHGHENRGVRVKRVTASVFTLDERSQKQRPLVLLENHSGGVVHDGARVRGSHVLSTGTHTRGGGGSPRSDGLMVRRRRPDHGRAWKTRRRRSVLVSWRTPARSVAAQYLGSRKHYEQT